MHLFGKEWVVLLRRSSWACFLTANLVNLVVFVLLASFVLSVVRRDGPIRFALVSLPFME